MATDTDPLATLNRRIADLEAENAALQGRVDRMAPYMPAPAIGESKTDWFELAWEQRDAAVAVVDEIWTYSKEAMETCLTCKDKDEPCQVCMEHARIIGTIDAMRDDQLPGPAEDILLPPGWQLTLCENMEWQAYGPTHYIFVPKHKARKGQVRSLVWAIHKLEARVVDSPESKNDSAGSS